MDDLKENKKREKGRLQVRLDQDLLNLFTKISKKELDLPPSEVIRGLVKQFCKQNGYKV